MCALRLLSAVPSLSLAQRAVPVRCEDWQGSVVRRLQRRADSDTSGHRTHQTVTLLGHIRRQRVSLYTKQ